MWQRIRSFSYPLNWLLSYLQFTNSNLNLIHFIGHILLYFVYSLKNDKKQEFEFNKTYFIKYTFVTHQTSSNKAIVKIILECHEIKWFVSQRIETRSNRSRQPTGMAGQCSPFVRIPFFNERGPGVGIDKSLQVH